MVIFVCGVVTGALVVKTLGPTPPSPRPDLSIGMPGQQPVNFLMRGMKQAGIELTPDQSNQVVKITLDSQRLSFMIRTNMAPQLRAVADKAREDIKRILTAPQQAKWESFNKEQGQRRGPPGGGRRRGGPPFDSDSNGFPDGDHLRDGRWHFPQTKLPDPASTNGSTNSP